MVPLKQLRDLGLVRFNSIDEQKKNNAKFKPSRHYIHLTYVEYVGPLQTLLTSDPIAVIKSRIIMDRNFRLWVREHIKRKNRDAHKRIYDVYTIRPRRIALCYMDHVS